METALVILLLISSIGIILSTILMEPKAEGMGSISGSSANIFGKTASRGKEKMLSTATMVFGVIFSITALLLAIF